MGSSDAKGGVGVFLLFWVGFSMRKMESSSLLLRKSALSKVSGQVLKCSDWSVFNSR